jgi:hypothetical protein
MGSPDPRSFSRGKRGIAGSIVFTVFNQDAFHKLAERNSSVDPSGKVWTAAGNKVQHTDAGYMDNENGITLLSVDQWEEVVGAADKSLFYLKDYNYADEIFPFDITITMHNEYGQAAKMSILGCEILNEGSGMSIDDPSTQKACTFIARGISKLTPIVEANLDAIHSTAPRFG